MVFVFFQTVACLRLDDMGLSTLYVCGSDRRLSDFVLGGCVYWICVYWGRGVLMGREGKTGSI